MTPTISLTLPGELLLDGRSPGRVTLGILAPLSGVMGIAGPGIVNCAILAAEQAADRGTAPPELVLIDAGESPAAVARTVDALVSGHLIHGLVGAHTSDVRATVTRAIAGRVPYVFTPPREFESGSTGSVFLGADPLQQLLQPLEWIARHEHVRRWALVGNDYIWPRQVHLSARRILHDFGQSVVMDELVPLGGVDPSRLLDRAGSAGADAILVSLVGRDGIVLHRAIRESGADQHFVRLSTTLDESCLIAAGGDTSGMLYSTMPSFILQPDDRHQSMIERYLTRFGFTAPLPGSYAEGCFDGVLFLLELAANGLLGVGAPPAGAGVHAATDRFRTGTAPTRLARADGTELRVIDLARGV